jgi:hypothetical protein
MPMDQGEIETAVVKAFIAPIRRERYLHGLSHPKRRKDTLDRLNHHIDDVDRRYRIALPPGCHSAADIAQLLRARGAPPLCYLISSWHELDAREMPLGDALRKVVGYQMGTIISCIPGQLGFYESEEVKTRYVLERKAG